MTYTLAQMTELLARVSPEPPATVNRQLRLWTDAGALPLVGGLRTGTGRGRLYEVDAPLLAAVAVELTRFGAPIGFVHETLGWLYHTLNNAKDPWGSKLRNGEEGVYMIVMPTVREKDFEFAFITPDDLGEYIAGPDYAALNRSLLTINLQGLWAQLA